MGSIAPALSEISAVALGKELWLKHQDTISGFWDSIAQFFNSLEIKGFKVFQDGLLADGKDGLIIINEGVRQGSVNYEIIAGLLRRGAILIKTEDSFIVKKEYSYIKKVTEAKSTRERETAALRYKLAQRKLLEDRDKFIVRTIDETLQEGDTGILFIGAYHEVLSKLPADIHIVQVKAVTMVKEYHRVLNNINTRTQTQFQKLTEYLISPISNTLS